jgi:rubrerythrin
MNDIEKVINWLRKEKNFRDGYEPTEYIDLAISALEKQIAKKPKELDTQDGLNCPVCYTAINNNNRYCPKCGQKIDCLK